MVYDWAWLAGGFLSTAACRGRIGRGITNGFIASLVEPIQEDRDPVPSEGVQHQQ